jgi:hypothetical protein
LSISIILSLASDRVSSDSPPRERYGKVIRILGTRIPVECGFDVVSRPGDPVFVDHGD